MPDLSRLFIGAWIFAAALLAQVQPGWAQASQVDFPQPSGRYGVGVTTWHWIDEARRGPDGRPRELVVRGWYPGLRDANAARAPYRPLALTDFDHVRPASAPGADFDPSASRAPIIIICPGRGVAAEANTALAEDLASHGYAVFAIDMPLIGSVVYPDGRRILPSEEFRAPPELFQGPYEAVDRFFEPAVRLGAGDVEFTLARIRELDRRDPVRRFSGRLDLTRIGLFGHSLGGRICGEVAAQRSEVAALAVMEAALPREVRRRGLVRGAILAAYSSELPQAALPNIEEIVPRRSNDVFLVRFDGLGHNSSTDIPLLAAENPYAVDPRLGLRTFGDVLIDFYDAYLKGGSFTSAPREGVAIRAELSVRRRTRQ